MWGFVWRLSVSNLVKIGQDFWTVKFLFIYLFNHSIKSSIAAGSIILTLNAGMSWPWELARYQQIQSLIFKGKISTISPNTFLLIVVSSSGQMTKKLLCFLKRWLCCQIWLAVMDEHFLANWKAIKYHLGSLVWRASVSNFMKIVQNLWPVNYFFFP